MAKYIIVGAILLVGAVVLGVSWFWTKKLLDKRAEGLDRRQAEIEKREALPAGYKAKKLTQRVTIREPAIRTLEDLHDPENRILKSIFVNGTIQNILRDCAEYVEITETQDDWVRLQAELWVLERIMG